MTIREKLTLMGMPECEMHKVKDNSIHICLNGYTWEHYALRKYHAPIKPWSDAIVIVIKDGKVFELKHKDDIKRIREDFHECQGTRFHKHASKVASQKYFRESRLKGMGTQSTYERTKDFFPETRIHVRFAK